MVSIKRPCAVVVSAQVSLKDLKPAFFSCSWRFPRVFATDGVKAPTFRMQPNALSVHGIKLLFAIRRSLTLGASLPVIFLHPRLGPKIYVRTVRNGLNCCFQRFRADGWFTSFAATVRVAVYRPQGR